MRSILIVCPALRVSNLFRKQAEEQTFVNSLVLAYVYLIFLNENVNKLPPIGDKKSV